MKKSTCLSFLIFLWYCLSAQDYYLKQQAGVPNQNPRIQIEALDNGEYIVASSTLNFSHIAPLNKIFIRKYSPCGEEIWARQITNDSVSISLTRLHIDSSDQILLTGRFDTTINNSVITKPILVRLDPNGNLIYSKKIRSAATIAASLSSSTVTPNGDFLLYFMHNSTSTTSSDVKIACMKVSESGNVLWTQTYNFPNKIHKSIMATSDNGGIFINTRIVTKINANGDVEWSNQYPGTNNIIAPVEVDSGYVVLDYVRNSGTKIQLIRKDGSLSNKWTIDLSSSNFYPNTETRILRKNGNILYCGIITNTDEGALLEIDPISGNIVHFKKFENGGTLSDTKASDISETTNNDMLYTGEINGVVFNSITNGRLNDTLSSPNCATISVTFTPNSIIPLSPTTQTVSGSNNTTYQSSNLNLNLIAETNTSLPALCSFIKNRGNHQLGEDTTLCTGESLILGSNTNDFDAYLWSTGSTNKTISVNQGGSYWLQVVAACDTLRDTIDVSYLPNISFNLGPDTIVCEDSIILGQNLVPSNNYTWSTGETSTNIIVKSSGIYWVEYSTKCSTFRDSITVDFPAPIDPIFLGNDTILCPKQFLTLGSINSPYDSFQWSDGSSGKTLSVFTAGNYWLAASAPCSFSSDTINVFYYPEIGLNLGQNTTLCLGDSIKLGEALSFDNYLWSDSSTAPTLTVKQAGVYWLEVQTNCGPVRDSITIEINSPLTRPNLSSDTVICSGENLVLDPGNLPNYSWSTDETSATITVTDSGWYWVETHNSCDTIRDSIHVSFHPSLPISYTISSNTIVSGDTLIFVNNTTNSSTPIWNFGNGNSLFLDSVSYVYDIAGSYQGSLVITTPEGCQQQENFQINVQPNDYFAPNIFSPNNDGVNDLFRPFGKDIQQFETRIYNRWGDLIFSSNNASWDGKTAANVRAKEGIYNYIIQVELTNGQREILKGNVSLVR